MLIASLEDVLETLLLELAFLKTEYELEVLVHVVDETVGLFDVTLCLGQVMDLLLLLGLFVFLAGFEHVEYALVFLFGHYLGEHFCLGSLFELYFIQLHLLETIFIDDYSAVIQYLVHELPIPDLEYHIFEKRRPQELFRQGGNPVLEVLIFLLVVLNVDLLCLPEVVDDSALELLV